MPSFLTPNSDQPHQPSTSRKLNATLNALSRSRLKILPERRERLARGYRRQTVPHTVGSSLYRAGKVARELRRPLAADAGQATQPRAAIGAPGGCLAMVPTAVLISVCGGQRVHRPVLQRVRDGRGSAFTEQPPPKF